MASSSSSSSPCAACKFLRRKCTAECVFAPYFPPDQPHKFANVHKIFGASNITKLLNELAPHQREDAVNSLAYEADARVKDPVYGCVGTISLLQTQVARLKQELALAQQELRRYSSGGAMVAPPGMVASVSESPPPPVAVGHHLHHHHHHQTPPPPTAQQQQQQHLHGIVEQPPQHQRDQLVEIPREQHLTREQVMEIARIGGGSYEAGLAILGLCPIGPYPRSSGSGDPGSSGAGGFYH